MIRVNKSSSLSTFVGAKLGTSLETFADGISGIVGIGVGSEVVGFSESSSIGLEKIPSRHSTTTIIAVAITSTAMNHHTKSIIVFFFLLRDERRMLCLEERNSNCRDDEDDVSELSESFEPSKISRDAVSRDMDALPRVNFLAGATPSCIDDDDDDDEDPESFDQFIMSRDIPRGNLLMIARPPCFDDEEEDSESCDPSSIS